jgi:uncharacterized LabA/DUF88 family protein
VYIDGLNLYFSLKENNWKKYYWLDIEKLVTQFLRPGHELYQIKYFTSMVLTPLDKKQRQMSYLNALQTSEKTKIICGRFQYNKKRCLFCGKSIPDIREKKTDVNIATHMLFDGMQGNCEALYLITGDSDFSPAVEVIKQLPYKPYMYLICPPKPLGSKKYRISKELIKTTGDHRFITEKDLKFSLFPDPFITKFGKAIRCPWPVASPAHVTAETEAVV